MATVPDSAPLKATPAPRRLPYLRAGLLFATGLLGIANFFQNAGHAMPAGGDTVMTLVLVYGLTGLASALAVLRRWRWGRITLILWAGSLFAAAASAPQVFGSGHVAWTASLFSGTVAALLSAAGMSVIGLFRQ